MNQDTDRLIQVVHYYNTPNDFHGIPFRFVAIKVSLQSRIWTVSFFKRLFEITG